MKCPRDGTDLEKVTFSGIELDKCHHCDGIWLDYGEIEQLCSSQLTDIEQSLEERYGNPPCVPGETAGYMRCPKCEGKRLQQFTYTYTAPVRVDRCEACFGMWVDKGELDAISADREKTDKIGHETHTRSLLRSIGDYFRK